MSRKTIVLLFTTDKTIEPSAILQCDTTGEYFPFVFNDWRDAIHYLKWSESKNYNNGKSKTYQKWCDKYGYSEEEEFTGNLNEFNSDDSDDSNDSDDCSTIFTSIMDIDENMDLTKLSAWK